MASDPRAAVRAYHDAWTSGDIERAGRVLADEVANPTPLNGYSQAGQARAGYLEDLRRFAAIVTGTILISELYGADEATLVYDVLTTVPVGWIRTAEHFRLREGRIISSILIFDATAWNALKRPATADAGSQNAPG